jgi:hypothetical protein
MVMQSHFPISSVFMDSLLMRDSPIQGRSDSRISIIFLSSNPPFKSRTPISGHVHLSHSIDSSAIDFSVSALSLAYGEMEESRVIIQTKALVVF